MFRRFTITGALIVSFILAGLLPLGIFGLSVIQAVSNYLVRNAMQDLQESVLHDAHQIQHKIDQIQGDLPVLSHVAAMEELIRARTRYDPVRIEQWRRALERVFLSFSTSRKVYSQIRYLNEEGLEVVRVDHDGVKPPQIVPREQLQNKRERPYFQATMALGPGEVYISPLELNREHGRIETPHNPVIRYATPVFDNAERGHGIVIINLQAGPLLEALAREAGAGQRIASVVDQAGFYLLHQDPTRQWGGPGDLNTGYRLQQDLPALAAKILSGEAIATTQGEQVVTVQSITLSSSSPTPLLIVVERMPTSLALAPVTNLRLYLVILLGMAAVIVTVCAVIIGSRLARPIVILGKTAERVQRGDLDAKVDIGGFREMVMLGDTFNDMVQGLADSREQIGRQLAELQARQRLTNSILRSLNLTERLEIALREILTLLPNTVKGAFYLVERERLVLKVHKGFSPTFLALGRDAPLDACPWATTLAETSTPWEGTDPITEGLRQEGVMAYIHLPCMVGEKLGGILLLANSRSVLLGENALRALKAMVDQAAVGLNNARLYTESQERLARLLTLREIDRAIAAQLSLNEVIQTLLERIHLHMKMDAIGLSLIDCEKKRTILANLCLPNGTQMREEVFALSDNLLETLYARQEAVLIYDLLGDPRIMNHRGIIRQYGLKSYLGMPLIVQGRVIGILHRCTVTPHRFEDDEIAFFETLAGQAAIAIQNARMYDAAVRRGEALTALTHGMIALTQAGPEPEAISTTLQRINRATGAVRSAWLSYDEAARRLHVAASAGFPAERLGRAEQALTMSLADRWVPAMAVIEGRSFYLRQTAGSPIWPVVDPDVRSAYVVPLCHGHRPYGVLALLSDEEDGFGAEAVSLADSFALYAGAALANSQLYRELQQAARQLEIKVEERTQELQAANAQLEAASRHKSAFLAHMSHELRTPLNAILGFSELLQDQSFGSLSAKQSRYVDHIHHSGKHLLTLINDLLDLAKIEAGKVVLRPESFVLHEALMAAIDEVRLQADMKHLRLALAMGEDLSTITADSVRFMQVLLNLLSNAVKATPEGGRITVTARKVQCACCMQPDAAFHPSGSPEGVEIAVQDTGIGIAAEDRSKLFQPFVQLENPFLKQSKGTGLGLALTRQLVELHGGRIWATSEGPDRGSVFTICLPLCHPLSSGSEMTDEGGK